MIDGEGRLHITRISTKKSWSQSYENRRNELLAESDERRIPEERRNLSTTIAMGSIIAKRLGKKVRRRLHTKKYSVTELLTICTNVLHLQRGKR